MADLGEAGQAVQAGTGSRAGQVRDADRFLDQESLAGYLAAVLPDFAGPLTVSQFTFGQSNPTFLLTTPAAKYAPRKKPPGELLQSAHQIEREYTVMDALRLTGVAAPDVLHLCQDASVIGTNFFLMRFVEGRIFSHPSLPGLQPDERTKIYDAACDMLVRLHRVDIEAVGLSTYGRRQAFVSRQLSRWTKQYQASITEPIEEMEKVIEWLLANLPEGDESGSQATLVHGDFRLDNMIFHATEPRILAVLDWELSTLGNPLSDLGYFCMLYHLSGDTPAVPGLAGLDLNDLGIPDEEKFVQTYLEKSGRGTQSGQARSSATLSSFLFSSGCHCPGHFLPRPGRVASAANAEAVGRMAKPCAQLACSLISF